MKKWMDLAAAIFVFALTVGLFTACEKQDGFDIGTTGAAGPAPLAVIVNGEGIPQSRIDIAYTQQSLDASGNGKISKEEIIENTVVQQVVIQYGKAHKVTGTKELEQWMEDYKAHYSQVYKRGLELYGKNDYEAGLENLFWYQSTKDWFFHKIPNSELTVTDTMIQEYLKERKLLKDLDTREKDLVVSKLQERYREQKFNEFEQELRSKASVTYP